MTDEAGGIDKLIAVNRSAYFAYGGPSSGDANALRRALQVVSSRTLRFCGNACPSHPRPAHRGFFNF
jgi:hypothetical protein